MAMSSVILCIVYTVYLLFGGLIFMSLEYERIEISKIIQPREWIRLKEIAAQTNEPHDAKEAALLVEWVVSECKNVSQSAIAAFETAGNQSKAISDIELECGNMSRESITVAFKYPWSFIDALYFSMTAVTTIGYGHLAPSTASGQVACILYTLVGIPLTGTLLAWTSGFFGERLFTLFRAMVDAENRRSKMVIGLVGTMYIMVGFVIFVFLPAVGFMVIEGWTYFRSVYYAYITLTTIGFGDYVTGKNMSGDWLYVYQICVIFWIMAGLGYWLMIASFLTKALRSEKIQAFAKKAAVLRKVISQLGHQNHNSTHINKNSIESLNFLMHLAKGIAMPEVAREAVKNLKDDGKEDLSIPNMSQNTNLRGIAALLTASGNGQGSLIESLFNVGQLNQETEVNTRRDPLRKIVSGSTDSLHTNDPSSPSSKSTWNSNLEPKAHSSSSDAGFHDLSSSELDPDVSHHPDRLDSESGRVLHRSHTHLRSNEDHHAIDIDASNGYDNTAFCNEEAPSTRL